MFRSLILTIALLQGFFFALAQTELYPQDYLNADFHKSRREAFRELMPANSVAVFFSNPVRNRANDVDFMFHQDPNLYYLTGYREPHAVLLIFKDNQVTAEGEEYNEIFFVQPKNELSEMWTGRRMGPNGVKELLEITATFNNSDFEKFSLDFSTFDKVIFTDFQNDVRNTSDPSDLYDLIRLFKIKVQYPDPQNTSLQPEPTSQNLDTRTVRQIMSKLRGVKTDEEIALIKKAVRISAVGQVEVMKAMHPGMSEREIHGINNLVYKKYGAEFEGYPGIVGAGHNGCILHYQENYKPAISNDELVLMDLGAEYRGYTADVTRTIPSSGKFSPEQRQIYELVLKAQELGIEKAVAGGSMRSVGAVTREVINAGLAELGVISSATERHRYYPHGCCHHIGLDVHDLGSANLEANMVITVEPGIYIPENSPCDKKWWGIAVRIEDDVLITEDGPVVLSDFAPRKVDEIEELMKQESALADFILPDLKDN